MVWDYDHLNIPDRPKAYVKGTAMGFAGLKKIEDRATLIAYLRTLADTPARRCRSSNAICNADDHRKSRVQPGFSCQ